MNHSAVNVQGARILVVDDVEENRKILTQTLEPAGYRISAAPNGEIALTVVAKSPPDLILLDVLMPGMNGFEVCQKLQANQATASIPVIFITANHETESVLKSFQVGAVDFISKPFRAEEVLARAVTHLQVHRMTCELARQNRELTELNAQLRAEMSMRRQAEQRLSVVLEGRQELFHTSGTLRHDAACYVERPADADLLKGLLNGEFCYVLTSRQMGKSSLMTRAANRLRTQGIHVATLDLTALGQNLTLEQWYDGLLARVGRHVGLEDELEDFWLQQTRLNPVQRFITALRQIVLPTRPGPIVLFIDEIDVVRSLPFSTAEFFAALRECYNRRAEDGAFARLTFCLLGVATPSDLISDSGLAPFNIGQRVQLEDLRLQDCHPLRVALEQLGFESAQAAAVLDRVFYWTHGHPYLTQRLCRALADGAGSATDPASCRPGAVDALCDRLFLSPRAAERDDNLIFVRERLLRSPVDLEKLFALYERVLDGGEPANDDQDRLTNQLSLCGITRSEHGRLCLRNRIYERVFDRAWVNAQRSRLSLGR